MSLRVLYKLQCDIPYCTQTFGLDNSVDMIIDLRRLARPEGWVAYEMRDYCPEHRSTPFEPGVTTAVDSAKIDRIRNMLTGSYISAYDMRADLLSILDGDPSEDKMP